MRASSQTAIRLRLPWYGCVGQVETNGGLPAGQKALSRSRKVVERSRGTSSNGQSVVDVAAFTGDGFSQGLYPDKSGNRPWLLACPFRMDPESE